MRVLSELRGIVTVLIALGSFGTASARAENPEAGPWDLAITREGTGPVALTKPSDFSEPASAEELGKWLARADGPVRIWLGKRVYEGDFVVHRAVTIRGAQGATLRGTGRGTVLRVEADGAIIENMRVEHSGRRLTTEDSAIKLKGRGIRVSQVAVSDSLFGIVSESCRGCTIERSHVMGLGREEPLQGDGIKLWDSNDSVVRSCFVEESRDVVVWYSRRVTIEHNTFEAGRYGSHFMYANDSVVRGNRIVNNVVGIFVMYSARLRVEGNLLAAARGAAGVGAGFKDSDGVVVTGNAMVANTTGAYLDGTPRDQSLPVQFRGNRFALNDVGVRLHGANEGLSFTCNVFQRNAVSAEVEGGGDALATTFLGNRWYDYVGYDLDHDGTGDVAYEVKKLSGEMTDAHPDVRFFEGTFAMGFVDAIARAVPVLASRLLLVDPKPLVSGACHQ